ncbi:hypothetical protein A2276_04170 [candidate division WOR-1 bacterium RIFOXYA12_FULL_43_27]|uniref:Rod shape-determining protein MreD n=1 Tax=candidate division WOR-1 bacterium RIFOXYC2_FULL_46_14 TaxID=1802587 RepID=A0A1F4U6W8_UNCSA|nr:MAG: hypothetical protein A2276_04170 [candidate division WOR-1 bacterium RIFOXYA12_FULL_43_27]OGC19114.1 MAG: hypothetical protein A2292_00165 [candidate division WOR-1 bacterium RIFOXYB2_FULL_46_45]OGC30102.1 MAG: hypothetical protein A2232_00165 [candidate division WOR-1 bacterium RIFOXYA2_FULL_46_56]OGC40704.1 MAG: hypothetical protein A2438_00170 [candidate division WOR-1 bacterium RIFOXYC2_FULL_46_14]
MKKTIKFLLFIALLVFIENIWPFRIRPDLFLLLAVTFSIHASAEGGVAFAFAVGFVEDILFSVSFLNTLTKTVIAAVITFIKDKLILEFERLSYVFVVIFSPLTVVLKTFFRIIFLHEVIPAAGFLSVLIFTTLLNLILLPVFLQLVKRFNLYGE